MPPFTPAGPVLVVDDNDEVRAGLGALLESAGFQVALAADGREALRLLRADVCPCLVLLDLMMPLLDGWDVLAELRRDASLAVIPVVVLSAHPLARLAENAGAVAVLAKPMEPDALLAVVDRHARDATLPSG
jgi:CheY-like chemotaxis protein